MKYRKGFVSNSSSSSFCIIGIAVDDWSVVISKEQLKEEHLEYDEYISGVMGLELFASEDNWIIGTDIMELDSSLSIDEHILAVKEKLKPFIKQELVDTVCLNCASCFDY